MTESVTRKSIGRLASELPKLTREMALRPWNVSAPYSELNWRNYENGQGLYNTLKHVFLAEESIRPNVRSGFVEPEDEVIEVENESWMFINGISASRDVLKLNGLALAELFGRKIHLLFNASEGVLKDVSGSIRGKLSDRSEKVAASLCKIIENELRKKDKVVLIAHSQGAQISASAISRLYARLEKQNNGLQLLSKLEFYTFGSNELDLSLPPQVYFEHFVNTNDLLAATVDISSQQDAPVFVNKKGRGHLLNAHYLPYFKKGKYASKSGGASRLEQYLR